MEDIVKVYVGTDPNMGKAEIALEHSIRKASKGNVEIIWMDYSRGGIWGDWNIGREHGHPYSDKGWATDFSCFRFAIPEANGFKGRAIYLDVDMILLKDIKDLFDIPMDKPVLIPPNGFDVILFDCSAFKDLKWWPNLEMMQASGWKVHFYTKLLLDHEMVGLLPAEWNCCDGKDFDPNRTCLIHYTDMHTQPWKPYPNVFEYPEHPHPQVVALWNQMYEEGVANHVKPKR